MHSAGEFAVGGARHRQIRIAIAIRLASDPQAARFHR